MFGMLRAAQREVHVDLGAGDDQRVRQAELAEALAQRLGLGLGEPRVVDDDERRVLGLGRQRMPAGASARTFLGRSCAWLRTAGRRRGRRRGTAARSPRRDGRCRCPSACRSSSSVRSIVGAVLDRVRAGLALGELPADARAAGGRRAARGRRSPRRARPSRRCRRRSVVMSSFITRSPRPRPPEPEPPPEQLRRPDRGTCPASARRPAASA